MTSELVEGSAFTRFSATKRVSVSSALLGDQSLAYYDDEGSGPVVVWLHGSGPGASGFSNFKGNYPFFAERGYRVIVPDTLGYGYSLDR